MKRFILSLVAVLVGACATTPLQDLGLQYVVAKTIEQSADPAKLAARIVAAADEVKVFIDFDSQSPADLQAVLLVRLEKSDLGPADKLLLSGLVTAGVSELNRRITFGELPLDYKLTANKLLGLVSTAAKVYVSHNAST